MHAVDAVGRVGAKNKLNPVKHADNPWSEWHSSKVDVEPEACTLLDLIGPAPRRILDLGCGAGRHSRYFSSKGYEVYGVDLYSGLLEEVSKHVKRAAFAAWSPGGRLPFRDGVFHAVVATRSIHHGYASTVRQTLAEAARVLGSGGLMLLQVPSYEAFVERNPSDVDWREPGTFIAGWGPEKGVPHHYFTRSEAETALDASELLMLHGPSDHYDGYCVIARKTV